MGQKRGLLQRCHARTLFEAYETVADMSVMLLLPRCSTVQKVRVTTHTQILSKTLKRVKL